MVRTALPVVNGTLVLTGGAACTAVVEALVAVALPSGLVAVTRTRSVAPTSAVTGEYVAPVAPAMSTPPRCHW